MTSSKNFSNLNDSESGPEQDVVKHEKVVGGDGKSGIGGAVFNLGNTVLGAGLASVPIGLAGGGAWGGVFLVLLVAYCSDYTIRLIVSLARSVGRHHYEDLCASQFGRLGYVFVISAMGIFAYGAAVAYLIGVGDNMSIVVSQLSGASLVDNSWIPRVVLVSVAIAVALPLSLLRNMSALSKTSAISILAVFFVLFVVLKSAIFGAGDAPLPQTEEDKALPVIGNNFFPAIGIIAFGFVVHHACFLVFNTLRDPTPERWAKSVHYSIGMATVVLTSLSLGAYLTFRGILRGSFLTNYSVTDALCNVMRCLFAVAQTFTFPLELFVARHSVHALVFPGQKWTLKQHYAITLLLWGSALVIAVNVKDLSAVLELTGGIAAVAIGFLMPSFLHFRMVKNLDYRIWKIKDKSKRKAACKEFGISWMVLVVGSLAMFFTLLHVRHYLSSEHVDDHTAPIESVYYNTTKRDYGDRI